MDNIIAHYQPIVSLDTGEVLGYETLARRLKSDRTIETPGAWLGELLANEDDALKLALTMLGEAAAAARSLPDDVYVSLNLEIADMLIGNFQDAQQEHGLQAIAHRLVIEVAEREALKSHAVEWSKAARDFGARIALDDFGAGVSRMTALVDLEPSYLKLDASVTQRLGEPRIARLVRFVTAGARTLGVDVIVEGVEDAATAKAAREAGAVAGQGWYFGRPAPLPF